MAYKLTLGEKFNKIKFKKNGKNNWNWLRYNKFKHTRRVDVFDVIIIEFFADFKRQLIVPWLLDQISHGAMHAKIVDEIRRSRGMVQIGGEYFSLSVLLKEFN